VPFPWRTGGSVQYSPYQTVWVRYGAYLVFMLAILGRTEGWKMVCTPRLGRQVFRSLLMLAMPFCFISAVCRGINLRLVWAMSWIAVPMTILMANVILRERFATAQWIAALIGLAGTWLFIRPPFPRTGGWLLLLPLGMGFCFALYVVLTREMRTEPTSANLFHTALWVFIPLSFVMPSVWHTPSPKVALVMIGIGVWGFVVLLFLDRALAWAPASLVAPFIYILERCT
jgi:drug/metabolite transporter (DMT)-like permease